MLLPRCRSLVEVPGQVAAVGGGVDGGDGEFVLVRLAGGELGFDLFEGVVFAGAGEEDGDFVGVVDQGVGHGDAWGRDDAGAVVGGDPAVGDGQGRGVGEQAGGVGVATHAQQDEINPRHPGPRKI